MSLQLNNILVYIECPLSGTKHEGQLMVNWNEFSKPLGLTRQKDGMIIGPYIYHPSDKNPNDYLHGAFENIKKLISTFEVLPIKNNNYFNISLELDGIKLHARCALSGDEHRHFEVV